MSTVLGLALLGVAAAGAVAGLARWRLWQALRRAVVQTPDELVTAARAGALRPGVRAVAGRAVPNAHGPLLSTVNHVLCVWHRHTAVPRPAGSLVRLPFAGRRRRGDWPSTEPFLLAGRAERIAVSPVGMRVDRPERAGKRYLPGLASRPFPSDVELTGALQYLHREWVIRPGTPVLVLGHVAPRGGRVVLTRSARGPDVISTRDAGRLRRRTRAAAITTLAVSALALVAGVVLLAIGLR